MDHQSTMDHELRMLKGQVTAEIKTLVFNTIIDEQVELLKEKLKVELAPVIERITYARLEKIQDIISLTDEVRLLVKVRETK